MSDALIDLQTHYKAVRARLNAGPPPKTLPLPEPAPEPVAAPPVTPPLEALSIATRAPQLLQGLRCNSEIKAKILPILEKHRINWRDASGKSQQARYVKCRFEIYTKLNAHGWSLSKIGCLCGDRDHTTVLSGIKRFIKENLSEEELGLCKDLGMRPVDYYDARETLKGWRGK
jgi:hypothetical protein